ncbi:hypothetical protein BDA99DRAFT_583682 [Phascolomyces articulosus]|uniref:Uncharacterized protein n=1 Tax=Phascolomyces articulosus TaxID=60185 RepID=A0AAD5PC21_9FUNG|nr:hypothetical protein BDA99DRAFT_583682 [Phascolomyces articulosus]
MKFSLTLASLAVFALTATAVPIPGDSQEASGNGSEGPVGGLGNNILKDGIGNKTKQEIIIYQCDSADYQKANGNGSEAGVKGLANNLAKGGLFNRKDVTIKIIQGCPEGAVPNGYVVSPDRVQENQDDVRVHPRNDLVKPTGPEAASDRTSEGQGEKTNQKTVVPTDE